MPIPSFPTYPTDFVDVRESDELRRWQAHVDAGRLGTAPPCPPDVAANRAATDALFRSFRGARRSPSRL